MIINGSVHIHFWAYNILNGQVFTADQAPELAVYILGKLTETETWLLASCTLA